MKNKLEVICTNCYFYRYDKKQLEFGQPYPPLGTLYAVSALEEIGCKTNFFDNNLVHSHNEIYPLLTNSNAQYLVLYDDGFNYLTKMCLTNMRNATFDIITKAKENRMTVIVNSSDSTDHFQSYHQHGADVIIHGEGERTLKEIITKLNSNEPLSTVNGISFNENGSIHKNQSRKVEHDLDSISMPAWERINIEDYKQIWVAKHGYFSLNLATTRGCPYKCNWCAKPIYGNRYNSRSPENVIDEIEYLINKFEVDYFWMCDDIFGLKPGWVQQFDKEKKKRELNFRYKIQSRVDLMLKEDNLEALASSGADTIWIGAESGSQKILDAMDKGTKVAQIHEATRLLKKNNIKVAFFLQFGYLNETWQDIQKTLKMVLNLMPDNIGISVSYPLPGTKFHERVMTNNLSKANWTDSDDLDLMFENTFKPIFYKTLHRYVHNRYKIKKGILSAKNVFRSSNQSIKTKLLDIIKLFYNIPLAIVNGILLKRYKSI